MDNKNEKTFADLFSSSTPESDSKEVHFGDLKDELSKTDVTEKEAILTFDNLFDKVESEQKLISKEVENKSKEAVGGLNSLFEKSNISFDKVKNDEVNTKPLGLNSLIFDIKEEVDDEKVDEELNSENSLFESENSETNSRKEEGLSSEIFASNVIQELESEEDTVVDNNLNSKSEEFLENSLFHKEEVLENPIEENSIESENHFLTGEAVLEDKELVSKEEDFSENPLFQNSNVEESEMKEISSQIEDNSLDNPFLESSLLKLEEDKQGLEEKENPLFQKEDPVTTSASIFEGESIFRDVNDDTSVVLGVSGAVAESLSSEENNISDFWEEPKMNTEINEKEESKSVSPFFEEETVKEENLLFLEKINLVENEAIPKKVGMISTKNSKHFDVKVVKKKEPFIKFVIGVISYAIFIWLLLIGVALLVYVLDIKIRAAKGDYSSPTFNAYVVLTGSMLPDIQVYDVVITKKVDAAKLEEKDVITFASADTRFLNTIITHRIIKKNYDAKTKSYTFQTKGDNNNVADSALVPEDNIYGKVILKIPKLGYLQEFLASDGGWIIVILIPCLAVISYDIVKLTKGLKKKKYKNIKVQK